MNLIVIAFVLIGGFKYLMSQSEAHVVSVDINYKEKVKLLKPEDFINVREYLPDIEIELRYASDKNILGKKLYENDSVYLRKGTADKLGAANYELKKLGYKIKIWDAYRPTTVQRQLWNNVRDGRYIANPKEGSIHNRGAAVDITLIDKTGKEILMPTDFDYFSVKADRNYTDVDAEKANNARLLEEVMEKYGFSSIYTEWWHFDDKDWKKYNIVDRVVATNVVSLYDNSEKNEITVREEKSFFEKLQAGIDNLSMDKIKNQFDYQILKLKGLFNSYKSDEY
jgi:D-alanyl-D-alanine dipeptidase